MRRGRRPRIASGRDGGTNVVGLYLIGRRAHDDQRIVKQRCRLCSRRRWESVRRGRPSADMRPHSFHFEPVIVRRQVPIDGDLFITEMAALVVVLAQGLGHRPLLQVEQVLVGGCWTLRNVLPRISFNAPAIELITSSTGKTETVKRADNLQMRPCHMKLDQSRRQLLRSRRL